MTDTAPIEDLYHRLIAAWNERDANAMAALYAPKGGQVGFDGSAINTPKEIEAHLAPIFRDHPTALFVTRVREVRMLDADVGLLRAVAGMIKRDGLEIMADRNAIQTLVASRDGDAWRVEMFQNTPARFDGRPEEAAGLTAELQALVQPRA